MTPPNPLDLLAEQAGVLASYHRLDGTEVFASRDTKKALLAAIGYPVDTDAQAAATLSGLDAAKNSRRIQENDIIHRQGAPIAVAAANNSEWRLLSEHGVELQTGRSGGVIELKPLQLGVYTLEVGTAARMDETNIIIAPDRAPSLHEIAAVNRVWGVTATLFGLRSRRNLGVGDYEDLAVAAEGIAEHGASFLGINPIHALGAAENETISPYSPTSRAFYNTFHIGLDRIAGFRTSGNSRDLLSANSATIARLRSDPYIDYRTISEMKRTLFNQLYFAFQQDGMVKSAEFDSFHRSRGEQLERFAIYETISETHGPDWRCWPPDLRHPNSRAVKGFAAQFRDRLRYHAWLQWIAEEQISDAGGRARGAGMSLGLYLDLAVGSRLGGAESWMGQDVMAQGVSLGAPPDSLSPEGQGWGLAAYSPNALRQQRYRPFLDVLRANMRYAGLLRIDHVLGLNRSFWLPANGSPGGYVRYPLKSLLALVALEATKCGTIIIGEDLGLVPEGFREEIRAKNIYGYSVMQFEKERDRFRDPISYAPLSLATFGTHDTPTLRGYVSGHDIDWWRQLGWIKKDDLEEVRISRAKDVDDLTGLVGSGDRDDPDKLPEMVHRALGRSASAMVAVQLDDVFGEIEAPNIPGTIDEHPNWRRRSKTDVVEFKHDPALAAVGRLMREYGRSSRSKDEIQES